jgi:hypothetical protein
MGKYQREKFSVPCSSLQAEPFGGYCELVKGDI